LKGKYKGFGPTLACEKLVEVEGLKISDESVRKMMMAEGLWKAKEARKLEVHQMRERRACDGELEQMDGTDHDWFEGRSERCTLLVMIDDATGKLGQIIRTKGYGVHVQWGPEGWFTQKKLAGGGALADMGIHALDTARFLLGDPQPISVYARLGTYYRDFDVDDTGVVLVNWIGGACSYIESGWWQPHADGTEAATQLYGLQGFGQLFPTYLQLGKKKVDPGFPFPRPEHGSQSMYDEQLAYFVKCIRSGSTPIPGGAEGLVNMKVIDAAYQSARTGKAVFIHNIPSNREQAIKE
jgi:hypothetical protein